VKGKYILNKTLKNNRNIQMLEFFFFKLTYIILT